MCGRVSGPGLELNKMHKLAFDKREREIRIHYESEREREKNKVLGRLKTKTHTDEEIFGTMEESLNTGPSYKRL